MAMKQQQQQHPSTSSSTTASPAAPAKPSGGGDGHQNLQILELRVTLESMVPTHVTADATLLTDVRAPSRELEEDEASFFPGAGVHRVAALGRLATPNFDVPDVRHVPALAGGGGAVAVSVLELARRGLDVSFRPGTCRVTDPATGGDIVGEGRMRGGRYYLDYLRVPSASRC